jgi:hypothetical protein
VLELLPRHLAPQQRFVVRRQHLGARSKLPANERFDGVGKEPRGILLVDDVQVGARTEVGEQQEAVLQILRVDLRGVHPGVAQQACDVEERTAVLLVRRCIHGDVGPSIVQRCTEITAEACVGGCALEPECGAAQDLAQPRVERGKTVVHGVNSAILAPAPQLP